MSDINSGLDNEILPPTYSLISGLENTVFAYIYNFIYRDQVFFYLSGIDYANSELSKPGVIAHALCIQHYIDSNKTCYDFLGGDSQYKRSLGSNSGTMSITAFQKHRTLFLVESVGRAVKQWMRNFKINM